MAGKMFRRHHTSHSTEEPLLAITLKRIFLNTRRRVVLPCPGSKADRQILASVVFSSPSARMILTRKQFFRLSSNKYVF
jgi:hypothetical protein